MAAPSIPAKPVVAPVHAFVDFDKKPHETFEAMHAANLAIKAKTAAGR